MSLDFVCWGPAGASGASGGGGRAGGGGSGGGGRRTVSSLVEQGEQDHDDDHDLSLISGDSQQQSGLWIRTKCSSTGSSSGNDSY